MYAGDDELFGFCMKDMYVGISDPDEAIELCAATGRWEADCRHSWVAARRDEGDLDTLVRVCGDEDCTLEVLDFRQDGDLDAELERCRDHLNDMLHHCVGHSYQRWALRSMDVEELERVKSRANGEPGVAQIIGKVVGCQGVGDCEGMAEFATKQCQAAVQTASTDYDGFCTVKNIPGSKSGKSPGKHKAPSPFNQQQGGQQGQPTTQPSGQPPTNVGGK